MKKEMGDDILGLIREKPVPVLETGFSRSVPKVKKAFASCLKSLGGRAARFALLGNRYHHGLQHAQQIGEALL